MDNSTIQLQAELDQRNSQKNINADIKKLQEQVEHLKLQTDLDPKAGSSLGRQLKENVEGEIEEGIEDGIEGGIKDGIKKANTNIASSLFSKLKETFKNNISKLTEFLYDKFKDAVSELKEVNTLLTEISRTNSRFSKSDLNEMGSHSFEIAGRYGKTAADYLSAVQEASLAGYEDAEGIAELSLAAQNAGGMTAELANQLIAAANEAYGMNGSVAGLTKVLDGMCAIAGHNALSLSQLSEGLSMAGTTAASLGVGIDETAAALGTMVAATRQSAPEAADAFRSVLLHIRQIADEEAGIDAAGLAKYRDACDALNVSLKETKNGVLSLRDPMEVLGDLAGAYNRLEENDIRRSSLLNAAGSADPSQLDALLRSWDTYETMLRQYADGTGSMAAEAEKTVNSWEGSLNRLSSTWTDTVGSLTDSDAVVTVINSLNGLLSAVNAVAGALGPLGSLGLGAGLFAGFKNVGGDKMDSPISVICFEIADRHMCSSGY